MTASCDSPLLGLRLVPLDLGSGDLADGIRAEFDVSLYDSWAGVLQLDDRGFWCFLSGPYAREDRQLLRERPGRADHIGSTLLGETLLDLVEAHLWRRVRGRGGSGLSRREEAA